MEKILAGDKFLCIRTVIMDFSEEVAYKKGEIYYSDYDNCITDEQGDTYHYWDDSYDEFVEHAKVIQELRGWLYEVEGNKPLPSEESSKIHYGKRVKFVKTVIDAFAEKYNLYVNVD